MDERVYYSDTRGGNLFGYAVGNDCVESGFDKGDIAIVNPNLKAKNGDYVLVRAAGQCNIKLYIDGNDGAILASPGEEGGAIPAISAIILGKVVERRRSYKPRQG